MRALNSHKLALAAAFVMLLQGVAIAELAPADAASQAVEAAPRVEFYSSAGCGYCRALRTYLRVRGISYLEHNINETLATREAFYAMGGRGTPLVLIGEHRIHGFDPIAIEAALAEQPES